MLRTRIEILDDLLHRHEAEIGKDFAGYRNHAYRVVNLCLAFSGDAPGTIEKAAVAVAFHDMGIWTDRTFDYLAPSIRLAEAYLAGSGKGEWTAEIAAMILEHHKLTPYRGEPGWLVEPFRRADWVDVSRGVVRFGLPRRRVTEIFSTWPSAGFHKRLVRLELEHLRRHPWNPLPMLRL